MSTLNPDDEPQHQVRETASTSGALGPSDSSAAAATQRAPAATSSMSISELDNHALETGDAKLGSNTDRHGTGERASADGDANLSADADIEPDRVDEPFAPDDPDADSA
jgi:hypothetical protein